MRQGLVHVHLPAPQVHRRVLGYDTFAQGSQGYRDFNGGAGLCSTGERKLLVDHCQNPAIAGINGYHGAIHVSQRTGGGFAYYRIFAPAEVARARIGGE